MKSLLLAALGAMALGAGISYSSPARGFDDQARFCLQQFHACDNACDPSSPAGFLCYDSCRNDYYLCLGLPIP
jgi:hypothetical protein